VIHIKLGQKRPLLPEHNDEMKRSWVGYDHTLSPQALYEQNRGRWLLGARAEREQYAIFSDTAEGLVRFVVEIAGFESFGKKKAIIGTVLSPGHPMHDALVGTEAPDHFRNPVTYAPDPGVSASCACGCGAPVSGRSVFVAGHDQRAVHSRITAQWGSTVGFLEWFDQTYGRPDAAA
jgi:hypothetical protein